MANVRDSDTSLWLHNKLGTSNDSWISGSICSQLNKEVLRNIKDCFPDLQTQVKLKLLLSFFHIPRRLVEEWKTELEEIIEVAGVDSELWVSMIAETIKTFPATGSLNTEISDYEETRPIFTDMVNDLRKMVSKHSDLGMLPLECQYLNKNALVSVVGQPTNPIKHFTLKRKPKSANLRSELLQKSADAQSSLKKASAPTIPLRSRGMPRKMTDTTPLKGIPSRVPTSGFRSPTSGQNQNRPNISRVPAGRKDGGIKLIEFTEQPLGYAAAKKRKRQQELEEQQKRILEAKQNAASVTPPTAATPTVATTTTPDYAAGLTVSSAYAQPSTPVSTTIKEENLSKSPDILQNNQSQASKNMSSVGVTGSSSPNSQAVEFKDELLIKSEEQQISIKEENKRVPSTINLSSIACDVTNSAGLKLDVKNGDDITKSVFSGGKNTTTVICSQASLKPLVTSIASSSITTPKATASSQIKKTTNGAVVISQTIIQPLKQNRITNISASSSTPLTATQNTSNQVSVGTQSQYILSSSTPSAIPALSSLTDTKPQNTLIQSTLQHQGTQPTKILLKTAPTIPVVVPGVSRSSSIQNNPPPLVSTQPGSLLSIQNVNLPNRAVTIQPASQAAQVQHIQAQLQQQQQQQQQQTVVSTASSTSTSKFAQVVMSPGMNVKGKTIILAQKGVILRSVGGDVYQQIPLGNVSGLGNLSGTTIVTSGPPGLVKTTTAQSVTQPNVKQSNQTIPALISNNNLTQNVNVPSLAPVVIASHSNQQPQQTSHQNVQSLIGNQTQQTIIRPVITTNVQGGITQLPQGLTLIQRPGQQPQIVQVQTSPQTSSQQLPRAIITQNQTQIRPQQIIIQHKPQTIITTQQVQQSMQTQQQTHPQRKGLSLSNEHVNKAHEMFRKANRVTRPDKALILAFMGGMRENPRPNPENVIVIKLGETEEKVKQEDDSYALMLVESLIRLDYNTGEWKTFQNYRRLDQSGQTHQSQPNAETRITQTQNSVVI